MPLRTAYCSPSQLLAFRDKSEGKDSVRSDQRQETQTIILAPTTEFLVQVEGGRAMAHLDVRQPFGDDVEQRGVHSDGGADDGDHNPALRGLVCGI